ncbi:MAG: hypothetical protein RLZZ426_368 [Actinomycetota bacterium]|jgi:anti-sigma factor (TIGR02949 family)
MSDCLDPQGLTCAQVIDLVDQYLDVELSDDSCAVIDEHLKLCPKCQAHADLERTLKDSVQRCCQTDAAPEQLRARVMNALATTQVEWISTVVVTQTFTFEYRETSD